MLFPRPLVCCILLAVLSGCASFGRADDAAAAKVKMIGFSREDVLACMGPPKKKAHDETIEVWSYASTDGQDDRTTSTLKQTGYSVSSGTHERSFCTVNVVMKDGIVKAVHYIGPTSSSLFTKDDECAYAVRDCLPPEPVKE